MNSSMMTEDCNQSLLSINCSSSDMLQPKVVDNSYMVVLSAIVLFGLVGNVASLLTIYTTKLRQIPANQYLIVLTVSNSVFLLTLVFTLLKLDFRHAYICIAGEYVLAAASYTSSWTITALTIERFLAIFYPLSRLHYGDMDRTRAIIGRMLPLPWIINLVMFAYLKPLDEWRDDRQCESRSSAWQISIEVADLVLCYVIPCFIVVVLNILVARRLKKSVREQISFTDGQQRYRQVPTAVNNNNDTRNGPKRATRTRLQPNTFYRSGFAGILIIVPVVYLLLNTPFYTVQIAMLTATYGFNYTLFVMDGSAPINDIPMLFYNTAHYLYYLNFASDFIVYAFSSGHFRQAALSSWRHIVAPKWQQSRASISSALARISVRRTTLQSDENARSDSNFIFRPRIRREHRTETPC